MNSLRADVLVIGFGGAGASAAIEAHDRGASVVILEKAESGGGTTQESSGNIRVIADQQKAANHYCALTLGSTPLSMMKTFASGAAQIPEWITYLGGEIHETPPDPIKYFFPYVAPTTSYPNFIDSDGIGGRFAVKSTHDEGGGAALWRLLAANIAKRNIPVLYNTPAYRLLRQGGRVTGAIAHTAQGELLANASRAVILASGGFSYNFELQRQFLGMELPAFSPPGRNTGDGVRMAQDVGADLWHMNAAVCGFGYRVPGHDAAFCAGILSPSFFIVDQRGRRFFNEAHVEFHSGLLSTQMIDSVDGHRHRIPAYLIFDEATRLAGPIATRVKHSYNQRFHWSDDNSKEVSKGWIKIGASMEELAKQLNLSTGDLELAKRIFDEACRREDSEFGRARELMRPFDRGPYYGISIWPSLSNTQGGPRRNEKSQVIDAFGMPIVGLYAAGELGSIWGSLYPGAGNVSECIVFGRLAGRNAAAELPIQV
jgi:succinate dehydrogenase/fumarate reductase flavoprotein subunit